MYTVRFWGSAAAHGPGGHVPLLGFHGGPAMRKEGSGVRAFVKAVTEGAANAALSPSYVALAEGAARSKK